MSEYGYLYPSTSRGGKARSTLAARSNNLIPRALRGRFSGVGTLTHHLQKGRAAGADVQLTITGTG